MKVLFIRFSSIGDIVLTTPVIRCFKNARPDDELHFAVKAQFAGLLEHNPYVDVVKPLTGWNSFIEDLENERYDLVIDLHKNARTTRIKNRLDILAYTFPKLNLRKWLYVNFKWPKLPEVHIVDRYFEAVKPLGIEDDGEGLNYFIPKEAELKKSDVPMSHHAGYIACVIGGSYFTKKFPVTQWKALLKDLKHPVILLGGREDRAEGEEIAALDPVKIYNACGKFSLDESADLVRNSKFVISNDTGLMHIAAAFRKKIMSFWGSSHPDFGMYPYYGENINVTQHQWVNEGINCNPCTKLGYKKCPKGHFNCMNGQNSGAILEKIEKYLEKSPTQGNS